MQQTLKDIKKKQKPAEGIAHMAHVNSSKHLGEGHMSDAKDYAIISKEGLGQDIDYDNPVADLSPKDAMKRKMEDYGGGPGNTWTKTNTNIDINDRLMGKLDSGPRLENKQINKTPINQPKQLSNQNKQILTEAGKAKKLGHMKGVKYINAFINLIKNPTNENRAILIDEMNKMVLVENNIHPSILPQYRAGLAIAEKELYAKLKGRND